MLKTKIKELNFSYAGVFLLLVVFPLFMTKRYSNITISKFAFFVIVSLLTYFVTKICARRARKKSGIEKEKKEKLSLKSYIRETDNMKLIFMSLLIIGFISMIFAEYPASAFTGNTGRYLGYFFFIVCYLLFVCLSKYYKINGYEIIAFEACSILIELLSLIQFIGLDPFKLVGSITNQRAVGYFNSTIGNVDVFAAFLGLSISIAVYMFCFTENNKMKIFWLAAEIFGFIAVFTASCESIYIVIVAVFWAVGLLLFNNGKNYYRLFVSLALFCTVAFVFGIFYRNYVSKTDTVYFLSAFSEYATNKLIVFAAVVFALISVVLRIKPITEEFVKFIKISYVCLTVAVIAAFAGVFIYYTFIDKTTPLNGLLTFFRFNDKWGNGRGEAWRMCWQSFGKLSIFHKLFGYGEDMTLPLLMKYFEKEITSSWGYTDNAHNEFLQYLITIGIFGLTTYIALIVAALKKLFAKCKQSSFCGAIAVAIIVYVIQSVVNITQPITTPLLFLFIAFAGCEVKENALKY